MNTKVADNAETLEFKDAARRLQEYLKTQGIRVKQAQALEALTASLAMPNWQTLRAKLTAPASAAKVVLAEGEPRWEVHALYQDNNQCYCDHFKGDSPLEAAIRCQLDRRTDYCDVDIASVVDRTTDKVSDTWSFADEVELECMSDVVEELCKLAAPHLGQPPAFGIAECEEYDRKMRALEFWQQVAKDEELSELLDDISAGDKPEGEQVNFIDSRGVDQFIHPDDALRLLVEMASTGLDLKNPGQSPKETGEFQCLQALAFVDYFGEELAHVFNDWEITAD